MVQPRALKPLSAAPLPRRVQVSDHRAAVGDDERLNLTDLQCLGLHQLHGPMTAGALARSTGLTTSAITAVIDRLERSGYASREHDAADRRRVIVRLDQQQVEDKIVPLYTSKAADKARVYARFSDAELAAVRDFLQALEDAALDPADRARPTDRVGPADRPSRQARS
jgi:DNA-binding MarR family transcriptional regulator